MRPSLREALIEARMLGCTVYQKPSTGEVMVKFGTLHPCRVNLRRKDSPACLVTFLRKVRAQTQAAEVSL